MKRILKFIGCLALGCVGLTTLADTVAKIEGKGEYETLAAAFEAVKSGDTLEIVKAGEYKMPSIPENITIKGVEGVVFDCKGSGSIASVSKGAKLEGLSFTFGTSNYHGWQGAGKMEFSGCTFDGLFFSYGDMIFNGCTFNSPGTEYCMWCYAGNITYKDCTVNCQGKFANVYNEHNGSWKISAEGCTFNSTKVNKAALNVKSTCGTGLKFDVTVNNCTVNENFPAASTSASLIVFNGVVQLDDIKVDAPNEITIMVDGRVVYKDNAPIPEPITVTVEKNEEKGIDDAVVTEISKNKEVGKLEETGLKEALPAEELAKGEPVIKVELQEVAANTLKFDVSPYVGTKKVESELNGKPVAVRLPLVAAKFDGEYAKVIHEGDPIRFVLVKKGATGSYVDLTLTHFSEIDVALVPDEEVVHAVDASAAKIQDGLWGANGVADMGHAEIVYSVGKTGLKAFRDWVNEGHSGEGQTFKLVADVDLGNEPWTPIGKQDSLSFMGTFNGLGYSIGGLNVVGDSLLKAEIGFFGYTKDALLTGFTVSGSVVQKDTPGNTGAAGVVGYMVGGTIDGVTNRVNVSTSGMYGRIAGICGIAKNTGARNYIKNCANYGNIVHEFNVVEQGGHCGGIVGQCQSLLTLVDCVNYGNITGGKYNGSSLNVIDLGGIVGNIKKNETYEQWPVELVRCVNYGTVGGDSYAMNVGGLIGKKDDHTIHSEIEGLRLTDCASYGVVSSIETCNLGAIGGGMCSTRCAWNVTGRMTVRKGVKLAGNASTTSFKGVFATCPDVAKDINGNDIDVDIYYTSIAGAIAAAKAGDTVKLVASSTEEIALPVDIKLDASGSGISYDPAKITVPEGYVLKGQGSKVYYAALAPLEKGADGKYHITSLNDLKSFRNMVNVDGNTFKLDTVVLDADIDLAGENWEPIGTTANPCSCWTFDGQGHKISNLTIKNEEGGNRVGFFGDIEAHPDLIGRYEKGRETVSSFKNIVFENVDIDVAGSYVGALIGWDFDYSTISNVTIQGAISIKGVNQVGGFVGHGDPNLLDCTVTGDGTGIISGSQCVGGLVGVMPENGLKNKQRIARNTVRGITVCGVKYVGGGVGRVDMYLHEILGNTVTQTILAAADESADLDTFGLVVGYDKAPVKGDNINKILDNTAIEVAAPEGVVTIVGETVNNVTIVGNDVVFDANGKVVSGTFEKLPNNMLAPGSVMDIDQTTGRIVVLGPLVPDDQGVYHIATMQDLTVFRLMVNGGNTFGGKTVVLDEDIDFVGEWDSGIGASEAKAFAGTFDGQDHEIVGFTLVNENPSVERLGLFSNAVDDTVIKNLTMRDVSLSGGEKVAGIVGYAKVCKIIDCKVIGGTITAAVKQAAGIAGWGNGPEISGCEVSGLTIKAGNEGQAAGIIGGCQDSLVKVSDCKISACRIEVTGTEKGSAAAIVGGICSDGTPFKATDIDIFDVTNVVVGVEQIPGVTDYAVLAFRTMAGGSNVITTEHIHWEPSNASTDYVDYTIPNGATHRINNFHPVAAIEGKGPECRYETLKKALQAAAAFPGTVEEPTVVQLYPGIVSAANFTVENFELNNVVVQGSENFASILKDTAIQSDGGSSIVWKGVTFKGILWDNSHLRASVFGFEDLAFIGNKFVNLVGSESAVHFTLQGPMCKNLTFVGNVFEGGESGTAAAINCASAAIKCLTGEITITNNVFKSAPWRSFCVRVDANDGIADKVVVTDNWFDGNKSCDWVNIQGNADNVVVQYQYNVKDDNRATSSATIDGVDGDNATLIADHNYFARTPDAAPGAFYVNDYRKAGNIYDAGVYPYYNAYHKDELAAGTTTVRDSLYNLVDPAAIVVNEDGKFVKMTIADAMAASKPGESVMLIRNAADEEVVIAGDVTFDTNGKAHGTIKAAEGYLLVDLGGGKYIAKTPVAEIVDGQKYDTLEKAIAAVTENQTIKMLANVALTKVLDIPANKSFTLDLNGKKISDAETGFDWSVSNVPTGTPANLMIVLRGTMKVCDTSANQDGSIWTDDFGYAKTKAVLVADNGNLTLESGTIYGEYAGCYVVGYTGNDPAHTPIVPTLTLKGGVISGGKLGVGVKGMTAKLTLNDGAAIKSKAWYGISTNGTTDWYDGGNCQITVNGGLVECEEGPAIYNPAESIIQIKGGVVKGLSGIAVKGGNVTISGDASVIATGVKVAPVYVKSGVEVTGDAIYIEDSYDNHKPVVSVIGGMLKSANGHAVQYWTNKAADKIGSLSIAGGSLIAAKDEAAVLVGSSVGPVKFIEAQVDEGGTETGYPLFNSRIIPQYIAEGYVEKDNGNGTWTVTKGQAEIEVVIKPVEPTVDMAQGMSDAEKTEGEKQAEQIKENIVAALSDPSISDIVGTGVIDATYKAPGELWGYVVDALRAEAPEGIRDQINENTDVKSHVEITFESLEVKVATEIDESSQHVVKSTLNKVTYEIKPILTTYITVGDVTTKVQTRIPSDQILAKPIEFALSLDPSFVSELAKVTHKKDDQSVIDTKTYPVKRDAEKAYIQLAWNQFSFADIEGQSVEDQVCTVNGKMYDSVATAAATADDGAVITLLKDIPSDAAPVPLKPLQVIELNDKSFEAPLEGVAEGYELAKTPEGQAFIAPEKIEVPTSDEAGAPKIKVRIAGMTADQLKAIQSSGRPLWADKVMGTNQKLIPFVPRSPIGIGTVTIRTTLPDSTFVRTAATARDGVSVKYQLKKRVGNGDFLEYGEVKDIPVFTVDAAALEARTSWKIETIFDEEY